MTGDVRTRSLAATVLLVTLALAGPLVGLTVLAASWSIDSERARITAVARLTGDRLRVRIDRELAEMTGIARTLATSPTIESGDLAAFEAQARTVVDTADLTVVLAELDGRQRINTRAAPGRALPTVPRPALAAALVRTRSPVVSGLMVSGITGRRIIWVGAPVIRDGLVTRIVSVVAPIEHFEKLIEDEGISAPYSAGILDGEGGVIALTPGAPLKDAKVEALLHGASAAGDPTTHHDADATLRFEHPSQRSDWTIVTTVDKAALQAPLRTSLGWLAALGLCLVGLATLLALSSARRASAELRALAETARRIGRGERVDPVGSPIREIDALGRALAEASRLLADERARLEARVEENGRALAASRTHYRALAESVGDVIVLRRQVSHDLAYVSPSSTRMFGYDPETIQGFRIGDNIHPEDVAAVAAVDAALGAGRQGIICLFRVRRQDGRWIWVESLTNRISGAGPDEPDVISVLRDVTERQAHAEELRIARDMAELAQAKAENANRAKSEFLAVMSHEIRTPLSSIKGFAELLADTAPLSAEQSRYVALVDEATATMITAVDDIVDFAKVESGELRVEARTFALGPAVEGVAAFLRPVAARRGVAVGATLAPGLPVHVLGEERRLRQILLNLMNALLRSRRGGVVTVSLSRRLDGADRIGFSLTASGGRAAPTEAGGLGPTIAQRLIGLLGGRLETIVGGAEPTCYRFSLSLPAAQAPAPAQASRPPGRPARLLLVEDHPINREVARKLLESAGHAVDVAEDGESAIEAVQVHTYDLLLMDVQMAGIDGLTATRRIRALQHPSRQVPILAMTASVLPDQVRAFREAGMNGHVAKPVDRRRLCAAVEEQLASALVLEAGGGGETAPSVFERAAYDRLAGSLGPEGAHAALRGIVGLLDAAHADEGSLRAEAGVIAVAARRLGFLDLAAAHERLGEPGAGEAALQRARIARELARRVFDELSDPGTSPAPQVALL